MAAAEMRIVEYEVEARPAYLFEFEADEHLQVESHEDFFAIAWSTPLSVDTAISRMDRLLPPPEGEAVLLFRDRRGSFATDLRSGLGRITQSGSGCVFARLEYLDRTMTWQAGESRFGVASPQLALLAERFDATYCAELLRDTATSTVGASANALVSRASYVGDRLPAGSLFPEPPPSHFRA